MLRVMIGSVVMTLLAGCGSAVTMEEPADMGTEELGLCAPPDPGATVDMTVDAAAWVVEPVDDPLGEQGGAIDVSTSCVVDALEGEGSTLTIELTCVGEDFEDAPMVVRLNALPASWQVDLAVGEQLQVDHHWHGSGHHQIEGAWLTMLRPGGELVLAATKNGGVSWMAERINHLAIEVDDGVCVSPCDEVGGYCEEPWRLGISVQSADGALMVVDGGRGTLPSLGRDYDVTVANAERYTCLNCPTLFSVAIAAMP